MSEINYQDNNALIINEALQFTNEQLINDISEDVEEIEPRLKYERINSDFSSILSRDAASCLAVHSKFIALGTHWGFIHIMDIMGNIIKLKELVNHSTVVNQISVDESGEYLASCSADGKVIINGLYTNENNSITNLDCPINTITIDPYFAKPGRGKQFVSGEDKVILFEKSFLRNKSFVLHNNDCNLQNIRWKNNYIAWTSLNGVNVYDISTRKRISLIPKNKSIGKNTEVNRCNIHWKDDTTLVIGWNYTVQICVVYENTIQSKDLKEPLTKYMEIIYVKEFEFLIAGIALHEQTLVMLSYDEQTQNQENQERIPGRPHLRLLHLNNEENEISNDALSIRGFQMYKYKDYHMESNVEDGMFFIVSPKDIVLAKQRDDDDHLSWLVEHEEFQEAMDYATEHSKNLKTLSVQDVGIKWFNCLFEEKKYLEAASICPKILNRSKILWKAYIEKFTAAHQLVAIAPLIPIDNPKLDGSIYANILTYFINNNEQAIFYQFIKLWKCDLYDNEPITLLILDKLVKDCNNVIWLESLAHLYLSDGKYEKALYIYIKLRHPDIFDLIYKHNLLENISTHVIDLMEFNKNHTVKLLVQNLDKAPIEKIVPVIEENPIYLHAYLDHLYYKDPHAGKVYHPLQVKLYADYDTSRLMHFLKTSNYISLQDALEVCRVRSLYNEMIYLQDRMGNSKEALSIIIKDLYNVDKAVDFCKDHSDEELWKDLIDYSVNKPDFVSGMLNNVGAHIDPIILIQKIKDKMEIPNLRNSLVKILHDYHLQISLQEGCTTLLNSDCIKLLEKYVLMQKSGQRIDKQDRCLACNSKIIETNIQRDKEEKIMIKFYCNHSFHKNCIQYDDIKSCSACNFGNLT